jgi:hypothetical protein
VSDSGWSLAIDFGTSFTTGTMKTGDGPPVLVEVEHSRYLPSAVVIDRDGQVLTGEAARRQAVVFPERAARVPKRALVAGPSVVLGDAAVPVTRLAAAVLGRIYGEAVRFQGGVPPSSVTLTHPARWGEVPLGRLREAAAEAVGSDAPVLVPEPVAAARWYGESLSAGDLVAVFDLGGGTLDTAVLRADRDGFTLAGPPGGDPNLGGEDLDELLLGRVSELARSCDEVVWAEVFDGAGARARRDLAMLRSDVTVAKEALSEVLAYEIAVPGFADGFRVTRREVDELFDPLIERAVAEMRATIAAADAEPGSLRGLYLTGGASRMPLVAARLAAALGIQPQMRDDPKAAVALGALTDLAVPVSGDDEQEKEEDAIPHAAKEAAALGEARDEEGDSEGASAAYRRAAEADDLLDDPEWALDFAGRLVEQHEADIERINFGATVYSRLAASDDVDSTGAIPYSAAAALMLGELFSDFGHKEEAEASYVRGVTLLRAGVPSAGEAIRARHFTLTYHFALGMAEGGYLVPAKSAFEHVRNQGADIVPHIAEAARLALAHLDKLQSHLNGRKGKITLTRTTTFWGSQMWGDPVFLIDSITDDPIKVAEGASVTRNVTAGPHMILQDNADNALASWTAVYVLPGKTTEVQCAVGSSVKFSVLS